MDSNWLMAEPKKLATSFVTSTAAPISFLGRHSHTLGFKMKGDTLRYYILLLITLVLITGCQSIQARQVTFQPSTAVTKSTKPEFVYTPEEKEQFVFKKKTTYPKMYGYERFCYSTKSFVCFNRLPYRRYAEMKGYFDTDKPIKTDCSGYEFYPVTLENGEKYYFVANKKYGGKYGYSSPIISLEEAQKLRSTAAKRFEYSVFDFEAASKGKRVFVVGGDINEDKNGKLYNVCETFDQLICSRSLDKYEGKKGFLVEEKPFIKDEFYTGYHIIFENGEKAILKLSNIYKDNDPIESSLNLVDIEKFEHSKKFNGKVLLEGLSVRIINQSPKGGLIFLSLDNGEFIAQDKLQRRLRFLSEHVTVKNRNAAFSAMKYLYLEFDEFESRWWVKPKSYLDMPLYAYIGIDNTEKWMRMKARFEGYDWVFFNRIDIISNNKKYKKTFDDYEIERDNGSGKVWEWADAFVGNEEISILTSLSSHTGKIRFTGKYESIKNISLENTQEINSILSLYNLTKS